MAKARKDIVCGIVLDIIGALMFIGSFGIKHINSLTFDVGSAYFPRICAGLLLFLGTLLIISNIIKMAKIRNKDEQIESTQEVAEKNKSKFDSIALIKALIVIAALILFTVFLKTVGFIICAFILLLSLILVLAPKTEFKKKNIIIWIIISAVASVGIYFLFVEVFNLILPIGIIG